MGAKSQYIALRDALFAAIYKKKLASNKAVGWEPDELIFCPRTFI